MICPKCPVIRWFLWYAFLNYQHSKFKERSIEKINRRNKMLDIVMIFAAGVAVSLLFLFDTIDPVTDFVLSFACLIMFCICVVLGFVALILQEWIGGSDCGSMWGDIRVQCSKCSYEWIKRVDSPKRCPKCGKWLAWLGMFHADFAIREATSRK